MGRIGLMHTFHTDCCPRITITSSGPATKTQSRNLGSYEIFPNETDSLVYKKIGDDVVLQRRPRLDYNWMVSPIRNEINTYTSKTLLGFLFIHQHQ